MMTKLLKIITCLWGVALVSMIGLTHMAQAQSPLPDVAVETLYINNLFPTVGQEITITAQIRNVGSVNVSGRRMHLYIDPTLPLSDSRVVFEPLIVAGVTWPSGDAMLTALGGLTFTSTGKHVVYAWVDPLERITESNEINNLKRIEFTVTDWQLPGDSAEPNDDCLQAKEVAVDGVPRQFHFTENDLDWFKFPVVKGQVYNISTLGIGSEAYPRFSFWANCDKPESFGEAKNFSNTYIAPENGMLHLEVINKRITDTNTAYLLLIQRQTSLSPRQADATPGGIPHITLVKPLLINNDVDTPIIIEGERFAAQAELALCRAQNNSCTTTCGEQLQWQRAVTSGVNIAGDKRLEATIPKNIAPGNYCLQVKNFLNGPTGVFSQPITVNPGQPILTQFKPPQVYNDIPIITLNMEGERLFTSSLTLMVANSLASEVIDVKGNGTQLQAVVSGLPVGIHEIKAIYPNKEVVLTNTLTVLAAADDLYTIDGNDILVDPPAPQPGRPAQLSLVVRRPVGQPQLTDVPVRFWIGDKVLGETKIATFQAGAEKATTPLLSWLPPREGSYSITAEIDPDNKFNEDNRVNNTVKSDLKVIQARADVTMPEVKRLEFSCATIISGYSPCPIDKTFTTPNLDVYLSIEAADPTPGEIAEIRYYEYVFNQGSQSWVKAGDSGWLRNNTKNSTRFPHRLTPINGLHYIQAWVRDDSGNVSRLPVQQPLEYIPSVSRVNARVVDLYRRNLGKNQTLAVTLTASGGDPDLYIWSKDTTKVSNLSQGVDYLCVTATEEDTYQIEVHGATTAQYDLKIAIGNSCPTNNLGGSDPSKDKRTRAIVDPSSTPLITEAERGSTVDMAYLPMMIKSPSVIITPTPTPHAAIQIALKRRSNEETTYGQPVVYDYLITNTGNVNLTDLQLSDNLLQQISGVPTSLAAGESTIINKEYRVKLEDKQNLTNQVTVTAKFGTTSVTATSVTDTVKMQLTELWVASNNTGGLQPFQVFLDSDRKTEVLSCNVGPNITADNPTFCGIVHSNVKYWLVGNTRDCHPRRETVVRTYDIPKRVQNVRCSQD